MRFVSAGEISNARDIPRPRGPAVLVVKITVHCCWIQTGRAAGVRRGQKCRADPAVGWQNFTGTGCPQCLIEFLTGRLLLLLLLLRMRHGCGTTACRCCGSVGGLVGRSCGIVEPARRCTKCPCSLFRIDCGRTGRVDGLVKVTAVCRS